MFRVLTCVSLPNTASIDQPLKKEGLGCELVSCTKQCVKFSFLVLGTSFDARLNGIRPMISLCSDGR